MNRLLLGPIIGGLSSTSANFWARAAGPGKLHAWIGERPDLADARLAGESLPLSADNGFTGVAPVSDLSPSSHYRYALTLSDAPPTPDQAPFPKFTTFPPRGKPVSFNFAFGSCFRPEEEDGDEIFEALEKQRQKDDLRFILLTGDQIYADAYRNNGIGKVATRLDDYREVYLNTWSRPALRNLLARLPAFMTLDDHEVDDDWTWVDPQRTRAQIPVWDRFFRWLHRRPVAERSLPLLRVRDALQAYWEHQGMHAASYIFPPQLNTQGQYALTGGESGSLAYKFDFGACAFFVIDTRTMRVKGSQGSSVLGEGQWEALERWLLQVKDDFAVKFVVTSGSLLFDSWVDFARDRWSGFPEERERLLRFLATNGIEDVYVLSGDLHFAHAVRGELRGPEGRRIPLWEFCATPFEGKPVRLAMRTYRPFRSPWLKNQELLFTCDQPNYGVVRVDLADYEKPRVQYYVYGKEGQRLANSGL